MPTCVNKKCTLAPYDNNRNCSLHCEKSAPQIDLENPDLLNNFYRSLISYILSCVFVDGRNYTFDETTLEHYLTETGNDHQVRKLLEAEDLNIVFSNIHFPVRNIDDQFDYLVLLNRLGEIQFKNCTFYLTGLKIKSTITLSYFDCTFNSKWTIYDTESQNTHAALYTNCSFIERVDISDCITELLLFSNCEFNNGLELKNVEFKERVFHEPTFTSDFAKTDLLIQNCTFYKKFTFNDSRIFKLNVSDSIFKDKVEFKNNTVEFFCIDNSNFTKIVDMYCSKFGKFNIKKSIFDEFVGFEKCEFGRSGNNEIEFVAKFTYATFNSFINFRNTTFFSGLDLEHINPKESPNFLNIKLNGSNTNRETYRIIKHSFDQSGNHLEANKFFAQEMCKYSESLEGSIFQRENFIFQINKFTSDFGQNYMRPAKLIIISGAVYAGLVWCHDNNLLYEVYPPANIYISNVSEFVNAISKGILPISRFLTEGMEAISLLFYAVIAGLLWQFIVSVKRHTRR